MNYIGEIDMRVVLYGNWVHLRHKFSAGAWGDSKRASKLVFWALCIIWGSSGYFESWADYTPSKNGVRAEKRMKDRHQLSSVTSVVKP